MFGFKCKVGRGCGDFDNCFLVCLRWLRYKCVLLNVWINFFGFKFVVCVIMWVKSVYEVMLNGMFKNMLVECWYNW